MRASALQFGIILGLAGSLAQAQVAFRYFYDGNHQLFRVLDSTGNLIEYDYDLAGNPTQIKRSVVSSGSLAILNIVPSRGTAGQTITIYGQNFSSLAAGDTVKFDGVAATVVSATATSLVVLVPSGVTTGPVTVTVGGVTASSGSLDFTVPPLPVITSISPNTGYPLQTLTGVTVQGANLTGATFELSNGAYTDGLITNVNVASSTQATFNLATPQTPGDFVLIANTPAGLSSSVPTPGNTLQISYPPGGNYATELLSVFNAYVPPGTDPGVPTGSNQADQQLSIFNAYLPPGTAPGVPTGSNQADQQLSVFNAYVPPGTDPVVPTGSNQAFQLFSVANNCPPTACPQDALRLSIGPVTGTSAAGVPNTGRTESTTNTSDQTLIAGQTIQIDIGSTQPFTGFLEFNVDGVTLASSSNGSLHFPFTVPHGQNSLELQALGHTDHGVENDSEPQRIAVVADPGRAISGRVDDAQGRPVSGATVTWQANGLSADYFALSQPPSAMPDLTGRQPARSGFVSALNFPNPLQVFGKDPIGVGLGENYAARFHGTILAGTSGSYGFLLHAHASARLRIDGQTIAEATATGEFADATGTATLTEGAHRIEVTYYESGGASTLQLSWTMPGGGQAIVSPLALLTDAPPVPAAVTGADGRFVLRVPAALEGVQIKLAAGQGSVTLDPGVNQ